MKKLLLIALLLGGCAEMSPREYAAMNAEPGYKPHPAYVVFTDDPHSKCVEYGLKVGTRADGLPDRIIMGCAFPNSRIIKGQCLVVLGFDSPKWLIQHELLHCWYGRWHDDREP